VQVIGVPDHKYGEEVCAWIRLRDGVTATAEEFRDFCRGQIAPTRSRGISGSPVNSR
jgi:fatty-acyl-CoA synthase